MYTYPEIKLQNKQDAFCAMYHNICRSIFALCGAYEGEGVIRSAVRAAGEASGAEQLKKLTQAKACTDLSNLYRLGPDIAIDPRIRANVIFDEKDRQVFEIYTCPLADYWKRHGGERAGMIFCEEYNLAKVKAYTENKGQMNLSKKLSDPRDCFCRFSVYFRQANMSKERAEEVFGAAADKKAVPSLSFDEAIAKLTISVYCSLYSAAESAFSAQGVLAVGKGLEAWANEASASIKVQARNTLNIVDDAFIKLNFPLRIDGGDEAWALFPNGAEAKALMQRTVFSAMQRAKQ